MSNSQCRVRTLRLLTFGLRTRYRHESAHSGRAPPAAFRCIFYGTTDASEIRVRIISAPHSMFVKRPLPFLALAAAGVWAYWSDRDRVSTESLVTFARIGVFSAGLLTFFLRRDFWRKADIVEDWGDHLIVTRWRTKISVPLSNVREVLREPRHVGSVITLILDRPGPFVSDIQFYAPDKRKTPTVDEMLDDLARRAASRAQ